MSNQTSLNESTLKKLSKTNNNMDDESIFKKLSKTNNNIVDDETYSKEILLSQSPVVTNTFPESDGWNEKKDKAAREAYNMDRYLGTYEYYQFIRHFPEHEAELVKCPTCEEMIYSDEQNGMCYTCFKNEQKLYPDDIPMELRYRN
jgi:hypothetical protein